jgi:hypothetical protein
MVVEEAILRRSTRCSVMLGRKVDAERRTFHIISDCEIYHSNHIKFCLIKAKEIGSSGDTRFFRLSLISAPKGSTFEVRPSHKIQVSPDSFVCLLFSPFKHNGSPQPASSRVLVALTPFLR